MGQFLDSLSLVSKEFVNSVNLKKFYDNSKPLQCAVVITDILHRTKSIDDPRILEHLKVDLKHFVDAFKSEFKNLGIDVSDYLELEAKN
ncbi:MAG: hypothetical protein P1P63_09335 [Treponemataceae bacterium]